MTDLERVASQPGWHEAIGPYSEAFQKAILFTLAHEIEWGHDGRVLTEHDPRDKGGTTRFGLDQASHPLVEIESLTLHAAVQLYHQGEWQAAHGEELPEKLAIAHFDGTVNQGTHTSAQQLQIGLGVVADGSVGPKTLEAARNAPETALEALLNARAQHYRLLRQFPIYGRGWLARVEDLRRYLA